MVTRDIVQMQPLFSLAWHIMKKHTLESMCSILFLLTELNAYRTKWSFLAPSNKCICSAVSGAKIHADFIDIQPTIKLYTRMCCQAKLLMLKLSLLSDEPNVLVVADLQTIPLMLLSVVPLFKHTVSFANSNSFTSKQQLQLQEYFQCYDVWKRGCVHRWMTSVWQV